MTTEIPPSTEPNLGEVMRTLARIEAEFGRRLDALDGRLDRVVMADLYEAHRAAMTERLNAAFTEIAELRTELDRERTERRADRRVYIGSALSLLVLVFGAALLTALNLN